MADTSSPLLGLLLMGTGGDTNAWGSNLNTQVITLIENAIAGVTSLSVSGGSHTLSATESRSAIVELSGTLGSNQILIVPTTSKKWTFVNQCVLAGFEVLVQTSGGTFRNLPAGWTDVVSDGTGALSRADGHHVGELFYHAGTTAPSHSLEGNGALPLRASYPDLFLKIGTTWGVGDGSTTFGLPNGEDTARFLRAANGGHAVGTYQSNTVGPHAHDGAIFSGTTGSENVAHSHSGSGTTGFENQAHSHAVAGIPAIAGANNNTGGGGGPFAAMASTTGSVQSGTESASHNHNFPFTTGTESANHQHFFSGTTGAIPVNSGTTETRPESMVGLLCIRY